MRDDHLYLDIQDLYSRGWTESLVKKFLGKPDRWESVDHFRNFTGKRTYFLGRIQAAEASEEFDRAYRSSLKRRRIDAALEAVFQRNRQETAGSVEVWREQLTPEDLRTREILNAAAGELEEARRRGYRTPHK
jgi:hypothetical protein